MEREINLRADAGGVRLDVYLAGALPELSRTQIQKLAREGGITVDGARARPSHKLREGESVRVVIPTPPPAKPQPEEIPLEVVFEDDDLLVVNKPPGLVVHPSGGHESGTLVNAILAMCPSLPGGESMRPGIVHRLDKDTSGLVVVAKNDAALRHMSAEFKARRVKKTYLALVHGVPDTPAATIGAPIGRDPRRRHRMTVTLDGRVASTTYRVRETLRGNEFCLLELDLHTGRTHQARVHLAWMGYPVVGDATYGRRGSPTAAPRQMLHAWRLGFESPGGEALRLEARLPADFAALVETLR